MNREPYYFEKSPETEVQDRDSVIDLGSNESNSPLSSRGGSPVRKDRGRTRGGSLNRRSRRESTDSKDSLRDRSCGGVRASRERTKAQTKASGSQSPSLVTDAGKLGRNKDEEAGTSGVQVADEVPAEVVRNLLTDTREEIMQMVGKDYCPDAICMDWKEGGRGRKPVSGELYIGRLNNARKQLIDKAGELRLLLNAAVPVDLSKSRREAELKAEKDLAYAPLDALAEAALEAVGKVDLVAQKAGNLKGEHRGALNRAAATLVAALTNLVKRQTREERDEEVEDLRRIITNQEKELVALRDARVQQTCLQETVRELQTKLEYLEAEHLRRESQPKNPARATKRRKMVIDSSNSEAEEEDIRPPPQVPSTARQEEGNGGPQETAVATPMDLDEEIESSRDQVLELISQEGMPAALRPPLKGKQRVLDSEVPARASSQSNAHLDAPNIERCIRETVARCLATSLADMEGRLLKRIGKGGNSQSRERGESRARAAAREDFPPLPTKEKGTKGKRKEEGKSAARNPPSVPAPAPAKKGQPVVGGGVPTPPSSTGASKTPQSRVQGGTSEPEAQDTFVQVLGRKARRQANRPDADVKARTQANAGKTKAKGGQGGAPKSAPKPVAKKTPATPAPKKPATRKVPRTAAVVLTCPEAKYAEYMGHVRQNVKLEDLGITRPLRVKRTATGALSLEVSGQGHTELADALAARVEATLEGKEGARVSRPTATADIRISGFEESVAVEEIRETLAARAGVFPTTVAVGPIRKNAGGLCTVVVKCPLAAANALSRAGRMVLGWASAKVEMLSKRPLQCYRCLEVGHTRATCSSATDRTGACYRCSQTGHPASGCTAPVHCAVCAGKGLPHDHRVGGPSCTGSRKAGKVPAKKAAKEPAAKTVTKAKPKATSRVEVAGFQVTSGGRLIAGITAKGAQVAPPPKEQRKARPSKANREGKRAALLAIEAPPTPVEPMEVEDARVGTEALLVSQSQPMEVDVEGVSPRPVEEEGAEDSGKGR